MNEKNLEQAVTYLRENQHRHSPDILQEQLRAAGYSAEVVQKAFAETTEKGNFWDFRSKRIYHSLKEKLIDGGVGFVLSGILVPLLGFLLPWITGEIFGFWWASGILSSTFFVAEILATIYLWNKRRYFAIGMLGGSLFQFFGQGFFYFFFFLRIFPFG